MDKTKSRKKRSIEELRRASLTVQYELVMLHSSHDFLQSTDTTIGSSDRDRAISNALVHSMLFAARNLLTFLYSHAPRESDIIAEDFFDDPDNWQKHRVVPLPEMANGVLIGQISKRLAHLTWDRADCTKPLWGGFRIVWNLCLVLQSFVQLADDAKIHEQLRIDVGLIMAILKKVLDEHPEFSGEMAPALDSIYFDDLDYFREEEPEGGVTED